MSARTATLDILVNATATGLDAFDDAGAGARAMADDLSAAASEADVAASKFDAVGGAADTMDSKAGKATAAMGALGSGLELVGADAAAEGLQKAAMATDFLSGAGQALTLVMDLEIAKKAANAAATVAMTGVAKAAAAGQWLLNAALSANPVGLVVIAVVALVAVLVLAYNKSETFRSVVQSAMAGATVGIRLVVAAITEVVEWFAERIPPAVAIVKEKARDAFAGTVVAIDAAKDAAGNVAEFFTVKLPNALTSFKEKATSALDVAFSPIKTAIGFVNDLIERISAIDFPDPPAWVSKLGGVLGYSPRSFAGAPATTTDMATPTPTPTTVVYATVTVQQTIGDPVAAAEELRAIFQRADWITA